MMQNEDNDDRSQKEHYEVEKVLDMKVQNCKLYYLVKWVGWDISTATWQPHQNVSHLTHLIKTFKDSRKHDQKRNAALKTFSEVEEGSNPYKQTSWQGHYLYGDQVQAIKAVKLFQQGDIKKVFLEIQWKPRSNGTLLENSFLESEVILEHDPETLLNFYESRVQLQCTAEQNTATNEKEK